MKSIVKKSAEKGLWLVDSPIPQIQDYEVLIKIRKTSICGTDLNIYKWDHWARKNVPVPLIVGHEFVGDVVEIGKSVKGISVGNRVSGEGHLVCGRCPGCLRGHKHLCKNVRGVGYHAQGCFAEYFALTAENVFILPDDIEDSVAAIFDPFGNTVHTALSFPLIAEDVLITGAGPIGMMAVAVAKKAGARRIVITDVNDYRLGLAKKMGADAAVNVAKESLDEAMKTLGIEHGFTVGLEMSGNGQALSTILEKAQYGAKIALLGILPPNTAIDWDLVIFKMLILKGIYGREIFSTWMQMVNLIESGLDLKPIITHTFKADNFEEGFQVMLSGNSGKVILDWEN